MHPEHGQPKNKVVALRLPVEQIAQLRKQAKHNHRTVTGEIRRGIDLILETDEEMQEAA